MTISAVSSVTGFRTTSDSVSSCLQANWNWQFDYSTL